MKKALKHQVLLRLEKKRKTQDRKKIKYKYFSTEQTNFLMAKIKHKLRKIKGTVRVG